MKLSLSARIAELEYIKDQPTMGFEGLARLANGIDYEALCIRSAQVTLEPPDILIGRMRQVLEQHGLQASMVSPGRGFAANTPDSAQALRNFGRHLDVAERLGSKLIRVSVKTDDDVISAQRAADQASECGIRLVHMTHTNSPFETVDQCLQMMARIGRSNFGLCVEPTNLLLCGEDYAPEASSGLVRTSSTSTFRMCGWMRRGSSSMMCSIQPFRSMQSANFCVTLWMRPWIR